MHRMSLITSVSFTLASSRVFCMRCVWRVISRTTCLRVRVRSRSSWMGAGGTNIAKPWRREIYLQDDVWPHPVMPHELAHIVAGKEICRPLRCHLLVAVTGDPLERLVPEEHLAGRVEYVEDIRKQIHRIVGIGQPAVRPGRRRHRSRVSRTRAEARQQRGVLSGDSDCWRHPEGAPAPLGFSGRVRRTP